MSNAGGLSPGGIGAKFPLAGFIDRVLIEYFFPEAKIMDKRQNSKTECRLGDLVEALYDEVIDLPLSETAQNALVAIMLGDLLRRENRTISFQVTPPMDLQREVA
jgi:hypothetical protein